MTGGAQYDSTHIYVPTEDFDRFVASVVTTFGGTTSKRAVTTVTPTPSDTISQIISTPVGMFSAFGYETPIPYPFGTERTGYLVSDMDTAVRAVRGAGANVIVTPFDDPIGVDAIVQFPGGVNMQLYVHNTAPSDKPLEGVPEIASTYLWTVWIHSLGASCFLAWQGHLQRGERTGH